MKRERRYRQCLVMLLFFILSSLGVVSFICCIAAEIDRSKKGDMKLEGKLCYLPQSGAYKYGIAALACLAGAQVIGGAVVCRSFCSREKRSKITSRISSTIKIFLFVLSWLSFGSVVVLLGTATSMNGEQTYGKGWLDGECYLVKKQVYVVSAVLILFSTASILFVDVLTVSELSRQQETTENSLSSRVMRPRA